MNPAVRSKGGFRMYRGDGVKRIEWIQKLQDMGFSLTEIKVFLRVWEECATAPKAMSTVREIFSDKLRETRETIGRLTRLADELSESPGLSLKAAVHATRTTTRVNAVAAAARAGTAMYPFWWTEIAKR